MMNAHSLRLTRQDGRVLWADVKAKSCSGQPHKRVSPRA